VWRAFFFAVGIMLVIVGVECLLIDSATLASDANKVETVTVSNGWFQPPQKIEVASGKTVRPADYIPWSLLASGAIVLLYSFTLPSRWGQKSGG
jgi:hypothetical protein